MFGEINSKSNIVLCINQSGRKLNYKSWTYSLINIMWPCCRYTTNSTPNLYIQPNSISQTCVYLARSQRFFKTEINPNFWATNLITSYPKICTIIKFPLSKLVFTEIQGFILK